MKKWIVPLILALLLLPSAQAADSVHRIGAGANYWSCIDDIDVDEVNEDGFSYFASYQFRAAWIGLEANVEFLPDMFGEDAIAPVGYLLVGKAIYAAAGVGIVHFDGEWAEEPFYALRAGLDLEVLPSIFLDISASYRFNSETELENAIDDIDTDTVFLGAAVRLGF